LLGLLRRVAEQNQGCGTGKKCELVGPESTSDVLRATSLSNEGPTTTAVSEGLTTAMGSHSTVLDVRVPTRQKSTVGDCRGFLRSFLLLVCGAISAGGRLFFEGRQHDLDEKPRLKRTFRKRKRLQSVGRVRG
jgi:hypothetical protein